jgi:hypothetical protein
MGLLRPTAHSKVVVVVEAVRLDDLVSNAGVVGGGSNDDGLLAFGAPSLVHDVRDGLGAERAPRVRVVNGDVEGHGPVLIEKAKKTRRRASEMSAMERDLPEKCFGGGTDPTVFPSFAFLGGERREMSLVLDLLARVVRARVSSDLDGPIEHAHRGL